VWGVEPLCEGNPRLLWGHRRGRGALPSTDAKQTSWVSFTQCPQTSQKSSTPSTDAKPDLVGFLHAVPTGVTEELHTFHVFEPRGSRIAAPRRL
jgi:hypothetical protein